MLRRWARLCLALVAEPHALWFLIQRRVETREMERSGAAFAAEELPSALANGTVIVVFLKSMGVNTTVG